MRRPTSSLLLAAAFLVPLLAGRPAEARDARKPVLRTPAARQELRIPAEGQTVWLFRWQGVRGATAYHLELHAPGIPTPVLRKRVNAPSYAHVVPSGYAANAKARGWNWRVRALFRSQPGPWSAWGGFLVTRTQPRPDVVPLNPNNPTLPGVRVDPRGPIIVSRVPQLRTPQAGAVLPNADQTRHLRWTFTWDAVLNAQGYRIEIRGPNAPKALVDTMVGGTTFHHKSGGHIVNQFVRGWRWRVRAYGNRTALGAWSPWRSFDVARRTDNGPIAPNTLPTTPSLAQPRANGTLPNADANGQLRWTFSWIGVLPAHSYRIQVRKRGARLFLVDTVTTKLTYTHIANSYVVASNQRNWEWRVQALRSDGTPAGVPSAWRTFHVQSR